MSPSMVLWHDVIVGYSISTSITFVTNSWVLEAKQIAQGSSVFNVWEICFWAVGNTSLNIFAHLWSAKTAAFCQQVVWASKLTSGHRWWLWAAKCRGLCSKKWEKCALKSFTPLSCVVKAELLFYLIGQFW